MSIEFEADDGSRAAHTLFEASEIKVVRLVLGTTTVLLTTSEHEGSKALNVCLCGSLEQQDSTHPLQTSEVAAADPSPSDVSQDKPVATEEMTEEEFVEKLRGWMMVLASLFASMTFQAGLNPPKQFRPDLIMEHGAQNPLRMMFQGRFFYIINSIVFAYSLGLVMMMLFQSSLSVKRLVGKGMRKSKRGLLCANIVMLLLVYGLGSADRLYDVPLPVFAFCFLVCIMYSEIIRNTCKEWWKKLRRKF